jgi:hypothetical protein
VTCLATTAATSAMATSAASTSRSSGACSATTAPPARWRPAARHRHTTTAAHGGEHVEVERSRLTANTRV